MKKFTLRLDDPLAKKLGLLAKKEKRSINNYLVMLIERESEKSSDKAVKTVYGKDGVNINYS